FSVKNYGPFRETATLSMQCTAYKEHPENVVDVDLVGGGILKSAVVFGPNGSGKSALIGAMRLLVSVTSGVEELDLSNSPYIPLGDWAVSDGTLITLQACFAEDGDLYEYSITFNRDGIEKESLHHYPKGRRRRVFERGPPGSGPIKGASKMLDAWTSDCMSYLGAAAIYEDGLCRRVRRMIQGIRVLDGGIPDVKELSEEIIEHTRGHPWVLDRLANCMEATDFGIVDIIAGDEMGYVFGDEVILIHEHQGDILCDSLQRVPLRYESEGTRQMLHVMLHCVEALESGGAVFIDDFGSNLHPEVAKWIVDLFHGGDNSENAQLVVCTHDLMLMDTDDLLRMDQIYFVNKDHRLGTSEIYCLSDFKRIGKKSDILVMYQDGRFDALPRTISLRRF
ncbi:MAG: ATP-binding protein, partial [Thermoplasmata archaeon]|nr:ATP-binding protein [Thermoplasmata archaeon]